MTKIKMANSAGTLWGWGRALGESQFCVKVPKGLLLLLQSFTGANNAITAIPRVTDGHR